MGAGMMFYVRSPVSVSSPAPNFVGMAAMRMLHCTIVMNHLYLELREEQPGAWTMGFFTEIFSRPRPQEQIRYRTALTLLNAMSNSDRADIGIKPADFPRIAREMALRQ